MRLGRYKLRRHSDKPDYFFDPLSMEYGIPGLYYGGGFALILITALIISTVIDLYNPGFLRDYHYLAVIFSLLALWAFNLFIGLPPNHFRPRTWRIVQVSVYFFYLPLVAASLGAFSLPSFLQHNWPTILPIVYLILAIGYTILKAHTLFHVIPFVSELPIDTHNALYNDPQIKLLHFTDIHVTDKERTLEKKTPGQIRFVESIAKASKWQPFHILLTGDITDQGRAEEWLIVLDALQGFLPDRESPNPLILLAPGNHDLSAAYGTDYVGLKLYRYLFIASLLCPQIKTHYPKVAGRGNLLTEALRAFFYESVSNGANSLSLQATLLAEQSELGQAEYGRNWRRVPKEKRRERAKTIIQQELVIIASDAKQFSKDVIKIASSLIPFDLRGKVNPLAPWDRELNIDETEFTLAFSSFYHEIGFVWDEFFPLYYHDTLTRTFFVILNSVPRTGNVINSAIGDVKSKQMEHLSDILYREISWFTRSTDEIENVVILIHHAMFRRGGETWRWNNANQISEWSFLSTDFKIANRLLEILTGVTRDYPRTKIIVVCGHRHFPFSGHIETILVLEGGAIVEDNSAPWYVLINEGVISFSSQPA